MKCLGSAIARNGTLIRGHNELTLFANVEFSISESALIEPIIVKIRTDQGKKGKWYLSTINGHQVYYGTNIENVKWSTFCMIKQVWAEMVIERITFVEG